MEQAERYKFLRQVHNATNTVTQQQKRVQTAETNAIYIGKHCEEKHTNTSFIFH